MIHIAFHYTRSTAVLLFLLTLWGCSGAKETMDTAVPKTVIKGTSDTKRALSYLVSGELYAAKDQHAQAILEYQDGIKLAPDESALHFATAKSYRALGKSESALTYAERAARLDTVNKWYNELLGGLYFDLKKFDMSAAEFEKFSRKDPQNADALQLLAMAQVGAQEYDKAIKTLDRVAAISGFDLMTMSRKFDLQMMLKREDDAILTLWQMIITDPDNLELYQRLGELNLFKGRYDDALRAYNDLLQRNPNDPRALVAICEIYVKKKEWSNFETTVSTLFSDTRLSKEDKMNVGYIYLERAEKDSVMLKPAEIVVARFRKEYPTDWQPYWFLGIIHLRQQHFGDAITALNQVVKMKPDMAPAWENLSLAYLQKKSYPDAIQTLKTALQKLPSATFRMRALLGLTMAEAGNDLDAVRALEESLQYIDTDTAMAVQVYSTLGISYDRMGKTAECERSYDAALRYDPDNALVLNNLAYSLAERDKDLPRSLEMAKVAVEKEPGNGAYLDTIGWVYYKLGNYEEAKKWILKAVDAGRESPAVLEHAGDVFHKLGDKSNALKYWQKALDLNRTSITLQQKINGAK
jgi:tetratricopeptide (TPR) repeat protein